MPAAPARRNRGWPSVATTPGTGNGAKLSKPRRLNQVQRQIVRNHRPSERRPRRCCTTRTKTTSAVRIPPVAGTASRLENILERQKRARAGTPEHHTQGETECAACTRMRMAKSAGSEQPVQHLPGIPKDGGNFPARRDILRTRPDARERRHDPSSGSRHPQYPGRRPAASWQFIAGASASSASRKLKIAPAVVEADGCDWNQADI